MKEGVFIRKDFSSEISYTRVLYEHLIRLIRAPYTSYTSTQNEHLNAHIHTAPKASQNRAFMHKAEHTAQ